MHQHYKVVFREDIYNMNILTEPTVSLLFALCSSNYLSLSSFIQGVLCCEDIRHPQPLENLKLESIRGTYSLSSAGPSFLPSSMEMWMSDEDGGGQDTLTPSFQVMAVPLWKRLLPWHILTDGWTGHNNQSSWVLPLSETSDLPDHCPLVTSACLGQHFSPHKATWSQVEAPLILHVVGAFLHFWELWNIASTFYLTLKIVQGLPSLGSLRSWKSKQSEATQCFSVNNSCHLLQHILTFSVVGWIAQVERPDVRLTES